MTQIAGLGANPTTAKTVKGTDADELKALAEQFAGLLSQNTKDLTDTAPDYDGLQAADTTRPTRTQSDGADKNERDYAKLKGSTRREITSAAEPQQTERETFTQEVTKVAKAAEDVIGENFDVSEEELEQLMAELGLTVTDLLQPQNLIALVQELTGAEDAGSLLVSTDFQTTLEQVNGLIDTFCQQNGLTQEQFTDLLTELSTELDRMVEEVKELLGTAQAEQTDTLPAQDDGWTDMTAQEAAEPQQTAEKTTEAAVRTAEPVARNTAENVQDARETAAVQTTEAVTEGTERQTQPVTESADAQGNDTAWQDASAQADTEQDSLTQDHEPEMGNDAHAAAFADTRMTAGQTQAPAGETIAPTEYLDVAHLMDQMEGLARTFANAAGTTVEMQLNPENLGKLVLTVTEKHGSVTAQIETTNEQVKESLQAQLIELRSTLMAQGVRVDAVEVTVATHEFEQNLDQNAAAGGQMAEQEQQSDGSAGRRNLNRSSLDELSGLMSEEEALVARMMRDNGGTVDYTA